MQDSQWRVSVIAALSAAGIGLLAFWWLDARSSSCVILSSAIWGMFSAFMAVKSHGIFQHNLNYEMRSTSMRTARPQSILQR